MIKRLTSRFKYLLDTRETIPKKGPRSITLYIWKDNTLHFGPLNVLITVVPKLKFNSTWLLNEAPHFQKR